MTTAAARTAKNHLAHRHWAKLRAAWAASAPLIESAGTPPEFPIGEFEPLVQAVHQQAGKPDAAWLAQITGLKEQTLHEGLYLMHKSIHVLGASQVHIGANIVTWSVSSAYHSAIFAARAAIRFLGVATAEVSGKTWLIDLFPHPKDRKRRWRDVEHDRDCRIARLPGRPDNMVLWEILLRVLRVTSFDVERANTTKQKLTALDPKRIGRERNALHYEPLAWYFDDLFLMGSYWPRLRNALNQPTLDDDSGGFSLALAFTRVNLLEDLLHALCAGIRTLARELDLVETALGGPRHSLYRDAATTDQA